MAGERRHCGPQRAILLVAAALCARLATAAPPTEVTGAQVKHALERGVAAIREQQLADGSWSESYYPGGVTCLATLALLQAEQPVDSDTVAAALRYIRDVPNEHTYVVSLKAMVLAKADAKGFRPEVEAAAKWLAGAQNRSGLWGYSAEGERFDHSNSQFALLGLDAASEAGVAVPRAVWEHALSLPCC